MTTTPQLKEEIGRILKNYREYVTGVYQGVSDYDEEVAIYTLEAIITAQVTAARINELGAVLSIYTSRMPHHEQVIAIHQAKDHLKELKKEQTND